MRLDGRDLAAVLDQSGSYRPLFTLLAYTELRIGEGLGLTWADVDFDDAILTVHQQLTRYGTLGPLKTEHGRREVMLAPAVVRLLRERWLESPAKGPDDYVFRNRAGRPLDYRKVGEAFRIAELIGQRTSETSVFAPGPRAENPGRGGDDGGAAGRGCWYLEAVELIAFARSSRVRGDVDIGSSCEVCDGLADLVDGVAGIELQAVSGMLSLPPPCLGIGRLKPNIAGVMLLPPPRDLRVGQSNPHPRPFGGSVQTVHASDGRARVRESIATGIDDSDEGRFDLGHWAPRASRYAATGISVQLRPWVPGGTRHPDTEVDGGHGRPKRGQSSKGGLRNLITNASARVSLFRHYVFVVVPQPCMSLGETARQIDAIDSTLGRPWTEDRNPVHRSKSSRIAVPEGTRLPARHHLRRGTSDGVVGIRQELRVATECLSEAGPPFGVEAFEPRARRRVVVVEAVDAQTVSTHLLSGGHRWPVALAPSRGPLNGPVRDVTGGPGRVRNSSSGPAFRRPT